MELIHGYESHAPTKRPKGVSSRSLRHIRVISPSVSPAEEANYTWTPKQRQQGPIDVDGSDIKLWFVDRLTEALSRCTRLWRTQSRPRKNAEGIKRSAESPLTRPATSCFHVCTFPWPDCSASRLISSGHQYDDQHVRHEQGQSHVFTFEFVPLSLGRLRSASFSPKYWHLGHVEKRIARPGFSHRHLP